MKLPFFLLLTLPLQAQHVSNPRASVADIPARIQQLQHTTDPILLDAKAHLASCLKLAPVAAPPAPMIIPQHYLNGSHGPVNPAEAPATRVYGQFENRITAGMDQYLATGNHEEAACALQQLDDWARAGALLDYDRAISSQAWYQVEWTTSSAGITESVLVNDSTLDPARQHRVIAWLDKVAHKDIASEKPGDTGNNHHYWRGLAATSVGVLASDDALFQFGVNTYKQAIAELDKNGAFPKEMARHERASHYQTFALQPLIPIAELAQRQHIDLYTYAPNGRSLKDAIIFFGRSVDDPSIIQQYTPEEQDKGFGGSDYAAFVFYTARFGTDGLPPSMITALQKPLSSTRIGGSITLLAAK